MSLELYWSSISPPSQSVLLTAKHLRLSLTMHEIHLDHADHKTDTFTQLNPQQCIPLLVHREEDSSRSSNSSHILWESRAIMAYLVNHFHSQGHPLYPHDATERSIIDRWLYFTAGTLHPAQLKVYNFSLTPAHVSEIAEYRQLLATTDQMIGDRLFVAGDCKTLADLSLLPVLVTAQALGADFSSFHNLDRYLTRLLCDDLCADVMKELADGLKRFVCQRQRL